MKDALRNFGLVTLGTLICLFMTGLYAKEKALSRPIKNPHQHLFLELPAPFAVTHGKADDGSPKGSNTSFARAAELDSKLVLWADVELNKENELVAKSRASGEDTQLVPLLQSIPDRFWILNFRRNRPGMSERIVSALEKSGAAERVLVQSPEDGLLKELREKKPAWLFGTSRAQTTLAKMLSSIGLEATAPIKGDVFVWESDERNSELPSRALIAEMHRRRKRVIVGPIDEREKMHELVSAGVDGVLVSRPEVAIE